MSSATRSLRNRSSRSSPAVAGEKEAVTRREDNSEIRNGQSTGLDAWVEPPVRNAVPSFEDTKGLERLGVLEHMAPLGTVPTQKLLQKLKITLNRSSPRMTPLQTDDADVSGIEAPTTELESPTDTEDLSESIRPQDTITISSPPRGRPAKKDVEEMRQQAAELLSNGPSPVKTLSHLSPKPQSIQDFLRQDRVRSSVQKAIDEARRQCDPKLIPGLELLLDDAKSNTSLWNVLDAIVNKTPTDAQFRTFKRYIKRGIKDYQSSTPSSASPYKPSHRLGSSRRHRTGPNGQTQPQSPLYDTSSLNSTPKVKSSHERLQTALRIPDSSPTPSPPRLVLKSTVGTAGLADQVNSRSSNSRDRSRSASTASSLSSAKSIPEQESQAKNAVLSEEAQAGRSAAPRQAANRVAAGSRTRSSGSHQPDSSHPVSGNPTTIKFVNKKAQKAKAKGDAKIDQERYEAVKRAFFDNLFKNYNDVPYPESSDRAKVNGLNLRKDSASKRTPRPTVHHNPLQPTAATLLSTPTNQLEPDVMIANGTSRKRTYDEMDKDDGGTLTPLSSSPAPSLPPPPPPDMAARGSTPRASRLQPPNKARKSARVMISPNKPKNGGITAGFSRSATNKNSGATNGGESGAEDNDEFCASCGGEGTLLCCDGCTNSFHHACLEPPLDPDQDVDGEWYCPRCIARRNRQPLPTTGLLARVIRRVDDTIPKAYALPFEIRDYFEGVKTGDEGEYEETSLPRTQNNVQKMNRAGFIEQPNYKEIRDGKGNFITCYNCGETANGRDIIPCDFCPAKWHTDCVDPPMAVPPRRMGGDKPNSYWRCPLHIDQDLAAISRQAELMPEARGRVPRLRKPKKAVAIDVAMTRGFRNNGVIEVDLMEDEMPDIKEISLDGGIYRLPEEGIRLDFIDRVKKNWYEDHAIPRQLGNPTTLRERFYRPGHPVLHHPSALTVMEAREFEAAQDAKAIAISETAKANVKLRQKSFVEQSAVLSLLGLSDTISITNNADPLTGLVNELIANAPARVEQEIKISERDSLLRLQALVQERLSLLGDTQVNGIQDTTQDHISVPETKIDPALREAKAPLENIESVEPVNGEDQEHEDMDVS